MGTRFGLESNAANLYRYRMAGLLSLRLQAEAHPPKACKTRTLGKRKSRYPMTSLPLMQMGSETMSSNNLQLGCVLQQDPDVSPD